MKFAPTLKVLIGIIAPILLAVGVWYGYSRMQMQSKEEQRLSYALPNLVHAGNTTEAEKTLDEILTRENVDPNTRALAARDMSTLLSLENFDAQKIISNIRLLKETAADSRVDADIRAENINGVAEALIQYGDIVEIREEIFKGEPFQALDTRNSRIALRNIYGLSNSVRPTARASINISRINITGLLNSVATSTPEGQQLLSIAIDMLRQADTLAANELTNDERYPFTVRYAGFLHWRAFATAGLAVLVGAPYTDSYRATFDNSITNITAVSSIPMHKYLPFLHTNYAMFLLALDNDTGAAQVELEKAVQRASERKNSAYNSFLKRSLSTDVDSFTHKNLMRALETSPKFKAYVESL